MDITKELKRALNCHQDGRLDKAKDIYARILEVEPLHPDPIHLLGVVEYQMGDANSAVDYIQRAIRINPGNALYYKNLGNAYKGQGLPDKARQCYLTAVDLRPQYAEAYFDLGNACQELGQFNEAVSAYQCALNISPDMAEAHNNLGIVFFNSGQLERAVFHYQMALDLRPDYVQACNNLGNALKDQGQFKKAVSWYRKAVEVNPDCFEAYINMGPACQSLGRSVDAAACFRKAIEIEPDNAGACNDLGTVYREVGRLKDAMASFKKCAALKPRDPDAYNNMGNVLKEENHLEEAILNYKKAVDLRPSFFQAHYNMGNTYGEIGNSEEAIACYRKTIQLDPDHGFAHCQLIRQLQQICAWNDLEAPLAKLNLLTKTALENGEKAVEMPFLTFALSDDPDHNFRVAQSWADEISARTAQFSYTSNRHKAFSAAHRRKEKSRISIGYMSADFKNHATAHLMRSLFAYHNRSEFEITAYSYGVNDHSRYRRQIERECDKFVDLSSLNHFESAHSIFRDEVDILVELKGYTAGNRLEICAYRTAPVQVAWLGFPGTTGADFLDYIITDKIVTPPDQVAFFSEKLACMPHTYQVNDCQQKIAEPKYCRQDFGLPEEGFIFCSFNEPYKIEPVMFDVWMKVLRSVPSSVLWLMKRGHAATENLKREAEKRRVAPERLIFAKQLPKEDHLARLKSADLFLDTRIVNGHTTTSDALWAGVPVLTLMGNHFASRVASSLLAAVGLPELVTNSLDEYERYAVHLANNPIELNTIKGRLAESRLKKPLFDTARFARDLEKAYTMMWQIYLSGEGPRQIEVSSGE